MANMSLKKQKISRLAHFAGRGQSPKYSEEETNALAINQKCVRDGVVTTEAARYHADRIQIKPSAILEDGDICINSTGTGTIGRVGLWTDDRTTDGKIVFADSHITVLKPKDVGCHEVGERIYESLRGAGIDVLLDDRDASPGVKFKDAELVGIPYRISVGPKGLKEGQVELFRRRDGRRRDLPLDRAAEAVAENVLEERR